MTGTSIIRLACAGLLGATAVAAFAADDTRVPGNKYAVVNQTGAALTCKYRVNAGTGSGGGMATPAWQDSPAIAAGAEFSRTVQGPGESVSLNCNGAEARADAVTLRPGQRYAATRLDDGKVVVTRLRA